MFLVSFVSRGVPEMARDPRPGLTTATPETHSALLTADKVAELPPAAGTERAGRGDRTLACWLSGGGVASPRCAHEPLIRSSWRDPWMNLCVSELADGPGPADSSCAVRYRAGGRHGRARFFG